MIHIENWGATRDYGNIVMDRSRESGDKDTSKEYRLIALCDKANDITELNAPKFARYVKQLSLAILW